MMYLPQFFSIDKQKIKPDTHELQRRLSVSRDSDMSQFDGYVTRVASESSPACCYVRVPVRVRASTVDLGFVVTESCDLAKNLSECSEAFVFAVTLGHGVDRLLSKLSRLSPSEHFICDAIASALAESVCDEAESIIKESFLCKPRFSPGYGDLDLSLQKQLLSVLNASRLLGITLTDTGLMLPQKSITAVMGVRN